MAYPTNLPTYTDPTSTNPLSDPDLATQQAAQNADIIALATKVGADSSAVATSLDYILKNTTGGHDHDGTNSKLISVTPYGSIGYAQVTADQTGITTTETDLTGLSVAVTVPAGRTIKVTGRAYFTAFAGGCNGANFEIYEGATMLQIGGATGGLSSNGVVEQVILTPSTGSHTYKLKAYANAAGTMTMQAGATYPCFILVELI